MLEKTCPKCGCQCYDPFGMGKLMHDSEACLGVLKVDKEKKDSDFLVIEHFLESVEDGSCRTASAYGALASIWLRLKEKKLNKTAPDAIESKMCCDCCTKMETKECPLVSASPWSRYGNYCNEFRRK